MATVLRAWLVGLLEDVHVLLLAGPPVGGCKRLLAGLLLTDPAHVGGHLARELLERVYLGFERTPSLFAELLERVYLGFERTHSLFAGGWGVTDRFHRAS